MKEFLEAREMEICGCIEQSFFRAPLDTMAPKVSIYYSFSLGVE